MTRKKSVAVVLSVILVAGIGVLMYWQSLERLTFNPGVGDDYAFNLTYQLKLSPETDGARLRMREMRLEALSHSTVTGRTGNTFEVESGVDFLAFDSDGREVVNTNELEKGSSRKQTLVHLLRNGLRQAVDSRGITHDAEFVDAEGLSTLQENLPGNVIAQLKQSMVQMDLVNGGFPDAPLEPGLSWQSPAVSGSDNTTALPAMTYTVSTVDDKTVSVDVTQPHEDRKPKKVGYILFDRHTGWPLQATLDYSVHTDMMDQSLVANARIELRRADQPLPRTDMHYEQIVQRALKGYPVDLTDKEARHYFLPPFGAKPVSEVLDLFNEELAWIPPNESDEGQGLDIPARMLNQNYIIPKRVTSLKLLAANGDTVSDQSTPNPRFNLPATVSSGWNRSQREPAPLLRKPLNDDQIKSLNRIEMTVKAQVPDDVLKATLKKVAEPVTLGDSITVSVESWDPDRIVLRASRPGGFGIGDWTFVTGVPLDESGNEISHYQYTASHTTLDSLMARPAFAGREVSNSLLEDAADALRRQSPSQRRGDKLITIAPKSRTPVASLRLLVMPVKTESQTWVAGNAGFTLNGGPVSGERTIPETAIRSREFTSLNMEDAAIEGVERHQLKLRVPEGGHSRCKAGLQDVDTYRGHSLSLKNARYRSGLQLQTNNGLSFFYDFSVGITLRCATRIEMATLDVDKNDQLKRVDASTVELSAAAHKQLDRISEMAMMSIEPVGRRADGAALKQIDPTGANQFRFWGNVKTLTLPQIRKRESRTFDVTFEPLP